MSDQKEIKKTIEVTIPKQSVQKAIHEAFNEGFECCIKIIKKVNENPENELDLLIADLENALNENMREK